MLPRIGSARHEQDGALVLDSLFDKLLGWL